jgi:hypothetical protein
LVGVAAVFLAGLLEGVAVFVGVDFVGVLGAAASFLAGSKSYYEAHG